MRLSAISSANSRPFVLDHNFHLIWVFHDQLLFSCYGLRRAEATPHPPDMMYPSSTPDLNKDTEHCRRPFSSWAHETHILAGVPFDCFLYDVPKGKNIIDGTSLKIALLLP